MFETRFDAVLRNMEIDALPFEGVNLDKYMFWTLQEADFRGRGPIVPEVCCATLSPGFSVIATQCSVRHFFGFVGISWELAASIADAGPR